MRYLSIFAAALISLSITACDGANADRVDYLMHYVQVPVTLPDGSDSADKIRAFEQHLLAVAGGFTKLGETSGMALDASGAAVEARHVSYLVGIASDERDQLAQYIQLNFQFDPYVFAWAVSY